MSNLDSKYIINLDLMQDTKNNTMHFNLSDSETSDFWINITRYGVDINEELLDKTVTLYVIKPNKNVEFGNISYDSTEKMYYCNLSSEFKNIKGNYTAQVVIYDSSTKERKVTRSKFKYYVEDDILSDASGTVKPEEQENILDDIISRLAALEEGGGGTSATASNISITDTGNYFTNSNVEGALQEVGSQVKDIENQIKEIGSPTDEQVSNAINSAIEQGLITGSITKTSVTANDTFTIKTSSESGGETGGENTPVIYNIINTLTNCINSNTATSIEENSSYTGTISANEGYTLGTPVITMGGVDITNSAYSNGTITISNVTGNIVITCSANEGFDLSKYLVATGYSVTSKSVAYSVMRFAADSKYNVYSFPVKASRYKLTATNVYSSGTYWLNQAKIDAMSTDQLATTTSSVTVTDGVPQEISATFTAASSYEYEGYVSIDGGYLYTCYVEFASEGNLIVACNPALNPTIEEVN